MKKRPLFTKEFKLEAVRLLEHGDKPASDLARELGIRRNQLYKWAEQLQTKGQEGVFPGHGRRAGREAELVKLQRENEAKGSSSLYDYDRFHLANDVLDRLPDADDRATHCKQLFNDKLTEHRAYITRHGEQP